jgi:GNAT superfamily N-acetyltransferase
VAIARRTVPLASDALDEFPAACQACVRWELDPLSASRARHGHETTQAKQRWWRDALAEGYGGGVLARIDGQTVGYATWSRHGSAGGSGATPTGPVSPDAVLLMALRVDPDRRGAGLGRWLVQAVVRQALRQSGDGRGARALEVYGDQRAGGDSAGCLAPVDFWAACGFEVVRDHPTTPRLRLDARRLATWRADVRADVEEVWVRLRGVVRPDPAPVPLRRSP